MERITSFRETHAEFDGRFIDVKYHELVSDPLAVVRQIYRSLEMRLPETAAERMQQLASRRSRYKGRRQGSALRDRGLGEFLDRHRFEAYCSRFEVPVGDHYL
jgi:LPS sulfotransferase NodH